jgi:hypothetical protein
MNVNVWFVCGVSVGHTERKPLFAVERESAAHSESLRVSELEGGLSKTHSDP